MGSGALVSAAFLTYPQFFPHFPAFLAPFLAMSIGLAAARLAALRPPRIAAPGPHGPGPGRRGGTASVRRADGGGGGRRGGRARAWRSSRPTRSGP